MTEADILATTYNDQCWVYRAGKVKLPTGETVFREGTQGDEVYAAIPCALSSPSGGKHKQRSTIGQVEADYLLFVRPEIDVLPSDVVVVQRLGRECHLVAGLAECHSSHNSVPVNRL